MGQVSLQFSQQADFGSRLIRWFGHGNWSHVDVVEKDGRLYGARSDVCAGVPAGVQSRPSNYATFAATKRVTIFLTDDQEKIFWDFLYQQRGKPYDGLAIFAFIIGRNWRDDDAWYCDELLSRSLEVCKFFPFCLAMPPNRQTPDDFLLTLSVLTEVN